MLMNDIIVLSEIYSFLILMFSFDCAQDLRLL